MSKEEEKAPGKRIWVRHQGSMRQPQLYKFGSKVYHQQAGAPIGARASGAGRRVIMNIHNVVVAEMLETVNNKPDLTFRYVDDKERFHVKQGLLREDQETSQVEPLADFTFKSAEIKALPG